jgi:hypothetical protein
MKAKRISAREFDEKFDAGEDVSAYLETAKARRPGREQRRVNVDLPVWMIESLDEEAERLGVTRQSVIKFWLAEKLKAWPAVGGVAEADTRR